MSEQHVSKYRIDQIAKELDGKWYTQLVTNGRSEYNRIVIEYGHKQKE